jgi:hypothetical protein
MDARTKAIEGVYARHLSFRNALAVAVTAVLVLAVAACGQSSRVIPWLNQRPAPVKVPPAAPPCRIADLSVRLEYDSLFEVTNEGRRACSLAGRPQLKLIDPEVKKPRLLVRYSVPAKPSPGSLASRLRLPPLSMLQAVPPHQRAELGFNWNNWCGPGPAPRAIELQLPGGGSLVRHFRLQTAPGCDKRRPQTELDYGPFYPRWLPKSVLDAYGMNLVLPLRVSMITKGLPAVRQKAIGDFSVAPGTGYVRGYEYSFTKVKRGAVFHFRVALRNTGTRPFRFAHCPLYTETPVSAIGPQYEETYVLNCHPVGAITPGKLAYFAMEMHVPKDEPLGQNYLGWQLIDANRGVGNLGVVAVLVVP